jgi:hypothetical protein
MILLLLLAATDPHSITLQAESQPAEAFEQAFTELCARIGVAVEKQRGTLGRVSYAMLDDTRASVRVEHNGEVLVARDISADSVTVRNETLAHVAYGAVEELLDRKTHERKPIGVEAREDGPLPPPSKAPRTYRLELGAGGSASVLTNGLWLRAGAALTIAFRAEQIFLRPGFMVVGSYLPAINPGTSPRELSSHGVSLMVAPTITPLVTQRFALTVGPSIAWHGNWLTPTELGRRGQPGAPREQHALSVGGIIAANIALTKRVSLMAALNLDAIFPLNQPPAPPPGRNVVVPGGGISFVPGLVIGIHADVLP